MPSIARNLMGGSFSAGQANAATGNADVRNNLTATGSSATDALSIGSAVNRFTTVASSTGAILQALQGADELVVVNHGANALTLYPPTGGTINNTTSVSVAQNKNAFVTYVTSTLVVAVLTA